MSWSISEARHFKLRLVIRSISLLNHFYIYNTVNCASYIYVYISLVTQLWVAMYSWC